MVFFFSYNQHIVFEHLFCSGMILGTEDRAMNKRNKIPDLGNSEMKLDHLLMFRE